MAAGCWYGYVNCKCDSISNERTDTVIHTLWQTIIVTKLHWCTICRISIWMRLGTAIRFVYYTYCVLWIATILWTLNTEHRADIECPISRLFMANKISMVQLNFVDCGSYSIIVLEFGAVFSNYFCFPVYWSFIWNLGIIFVLKIRKRKKFVNKIFKNQIRTHCDEIWKGPETVHIMWHLKVNKSEF